MSIPGQLNAPQRLLLGPGPSDAHPRVLSVMSTPLLGHLDPAFIEIMNDVQSMLRLVYRTNHKLTLPISATGTAGMECCLVNLLEPGDRAVVCCMGYFGQRMIEVAGRTGAEVIELHAKWGEVFDLNVVRETIQKVRPKVLAMVHAETSTGALQTDLDQFGRMCREMGVLLVVDAVTSFACTPLLVDEWGIDAVFSCSQKGLGCPPGLSPVSFSDRAVEALNARKTPVRSWYLDLTFVQKYWGGDRTYHHTAPITANYAIREGLRIVLEEGLENRWARHQRNHLALKAGLNALGLTYTAVEGRQMPQLNAVRIPDGVDDLAVRKMMLTEFGIEIGGGLGDFKGKAWRIGLMGYNSRPAAVLLVLGALEQCLSKFGVKLTPGAGVAAANRFYTS